MAQMMEETKHTVEDLDPNFVYDFLNQNYEDYDIRIVPVIHEIIDQFLRRGGDWNSEIPNSTLIIDVLRVHKIEETNENGVEEIQLDIEKFVNLLGKKYTPFRVDEFERALGTMVYVEMDWGKYPY